MARDADLNLLPQQAASKDLAKFGHIVFKRSDRMSDNAWPAPQRDPHLVARGSSQSAPFKIGWMSQAKMESIGEQQKPTMRPSSYQDSQGWPLVFSYRPGAIVSKLRFCDRQFHTQKCGIGDLSP